VKIVKSRWFACLNPAQRDKWMLLAVILGEIKVLAQDKKRFMNVKVQKRTLPKGISANYT